MSVFKTKGNAYGHIILRGGGGKPNYETAHVKKVEEKLKEAGLPLRIVIDCSNGNSNKNYKLQTVAFNDAIAQIVEGNTSILGMMLESHLYEGHQSIPCDLSKLKYGISVTDQCIGWEQTEEIILAAHERLSKEAIAVCG